MEKKLDYDDINRAIQMAIGWKLTSCPDVSRERIIEFFGVKYGNDLYENIDIILNKLNDIKPDWSIQDLNSASLLSSSLIGEEYKYLTSETLESLKWVYSWWWR